jgi:hypothetical protein
VIRFYVKSKPNERLLREFYVKTQTWEYRTKKVPADSLKDTLYWRRVWEKVWYYSRQFNKLQREPKKRYFAYWAGVFEGKFSTWDDFQIQYAGFRHQADGNLAKWISHLDSQFEKNNKAGDWNRITKWIRLFRSHKDKVEEYYKKFNFDKMSNDEIFSLMKVFFDDIRDAGLAKNLFRKLRLAEIPDRKKGAIAQYLWDKDEALVKECYMTFKDKDAGKYGLLCYYHRKKNAKEGLPLAKEMTNVARYAKDAWWKKAEFHQWTRQYKQAIESYRMCQNEPSNLWRIVDCWLGMGKPNSALMQLTEIENFFKNQASRAALRKAYVYKGAGKRKLYIAALRRVMKKYPKSGESREAHVRLEKMGVKIGGAVDAD